MTKAAVGFPEPPDIEKAFAELGRALGDLTFLFQAQGIMVMVINGDEDSSKETLRKLPDDRLVKLHEAARRLSDLTERELRRWSWKGICTQPRKQPRKSE